MIGQVAQHLGIGVGDAYEPAAGARLERLDALRVALLDPQLARWNRVAVRVVRGVAQLARDQLLELLRQHVLQHLGLVVHAVPGHVEVFGQVELEQPVVAQHLEGYALSGFGEPHALVGHVLHEPGRAQLLRHVGRRGRGDAQARRDRVRVHRMAALRLQRVNGLRVVLDGSGGVTFSRHA